jgi:VWFA-related protein
MTCMLRGCALMLPAVFVLALAGVGARTPATEDKTIFVGAVDESGKPVQGLTTDDFRLREDGVDREIISVKPATQTLNIELLADTTAAANEVLQDLRKSLAAFVHQVHAVSPEAQIALMEFGQASVRVVPFTTTDADLEKGINTLIGKPGAASVLIEAIIAASNNLAKRPSPRRAIVAVNIEPSDERSREEPKKIQEALRKSVAQFWAVSLQKGALKNPSRDAVLNALTKNTGGRREFIVGQSAIEPILKQYADTLTSQYEVTYKRPGSAQVVQVGVTRTGVKLHASAFAPQ